MSFNENSEAEVRELGTIQDVLAMFKAAKLSKWLVYDLARMERERAQKQAAGVPTGDVPVRRLRSVLKTGSTGRYLYDLADARESIRLTVEVIRLNRRTDARFTEGRVTYMPAPLAAKELDKTVDTLANWEIKTPYLDDPIRRAGTWLAMNSKGKVCAMPVAFYAQSEINRAKNAQQKAAKLTEALRTAGRVTGAQAESDPGIGINAATLESYGRRSLPQLGDKSLDVKRLPVPVNGTIVKRNTWLRSELLLLKGGKEYIEPEEAETWVSLNKIMPVTGLKYGTIWWIRVNVGKLPMPGDERVKAEAADGKQRGYHRPGMKNPMPLRYKGIEMRRKGGLVIQQGRYCLEDGEKIGQLERAFQAAAESDTCKSKDGTKTLIYAQAVKDRLKLGDLRSEWSTEGWAALGGEKFCREPVQTRSTNRGKAWAYWDEHVERVEKLKNADPADLDERDVFVDDEGWTYRPLYFAKKIIPLWMLRLGAGPSDDQPIHTRQEKLPYRWLRAHEPQTVFRVADLYREAKRLGRAGGHEPERVFCPLPPAGAHRISPPKSAKKKPRHRPPEYDARADAMFVANWKASGLKLPEFARGRGVPAAEATKIATRHRYRSAQK